MKKRMLLPLIFLLTFTLWLTPTPAAEEWGPPWKQSRNWGVESKQLAFP